MGRFLIGNFANEVRNGRLNGSSSNVEKLSNGADNTAYTKKIRRKHETFPYVSGQSAKYNIKKFAIERGHKVSLVFSHSTKEALSEGNPYENYDEDVLGFMIAKNLEISESEYALISAEQKKDFKLVSKGTSKFYVKNITKKRRARLMISPLQAIESTKIKREYCVKGTDNYNVLYQKEVYSSIMSAGFNLDIARVGVFSASEDASGFRDYARGEKSLEDLLIGEDGAFSLDRIERYRRVETTIRALQHYNSSICATNNSEDLTAKFIVLGEYTIGNNIFNNIFRNGTLDFEYLREAIEENEEFRISPIWIGVRKGFMQQSHKGSMMDLKEIADEYFASSKSIFITSVKEACDECLFYLKRTLF